MRLYFLWKQVRPLWGTREPLAGAWFRDDQAVLVGDGPVGSEAASFFGDPQGPVFAGKADGEATLIYANAFKRDPEFYSFIQTLDIYKETMDKNSTLILSTDSEFLKYFKGYKGYEGNE